MVGELQYGDNKNTISLKFPFGLLGRRFLGRVQFCTPNTVRQSYIPFIAQETSIFRKNNDF